MRRLRDFGRVVSSGTILKNGDVVSVFLAGMAAALLDMLVIHPRRHFDAPPPTHFAAAIVVSVFACATSAALVALLVRRRRWAGAAAIYTGPPLLLLLTSQDVTAILMLKGPLRITVAAAGFLAAAVVLRFAIDALGARTAAAITLTGMSIVAGSAFMLVWSSLHIAPLLWGRPMPAAGARNVVLIFLDTVRGDACCGDASATPHLAAFARQSVVFSNAIAPANWTIPSHASVLLGESPWKISMNLQDIGAPGREWLAARFRARGYETHAVISNFIVHRAMGFATGYDTYDCAEEFDDFMHTTLVAFLAEHGGPRTSIYPGAVVAAKAARRIRGARRPYFLTLNVCDAHSPYPDYCAGIREQASETQMARANAAMTGGPPLDATTRALLRADYAKSLRCMDASVGRILEQVEPDVRSGRTVVAIVGDHGELFGEHGFYFHGRSLLRNLVRVPMMIREAGLRPQVITGMTNARGLYDALLIAAAGDGSRVVPAMTVHAPVSVAIAGGLGVEPPGHRWSLFDGPLHYVRSDDRRVELYDWQTDPDETRNLSGTPEYAAAEASMAKRIDAAVADQSGATQSLEALPYLH